MDLLSSNFFYPLSRFLLWPQCCGIAEHCIVFLGEFFTWTKVLLLFFKMIILARSRAKETNGTKVWCMAWLKTNSRPEGTKHHEIIFLSTRCFLLMQFSIDQPIKCEHSEHRFSAGKFKIKVFQNIIFKNCLILNFRAKIRVLKFQVIVFKLQSLNFRAKMRTF